MKQGIHGIDEIKNKFIFNKLYFMNDNNDNHIVDKHIFFKYLTVNSH